MEHAIEGPFCWGDTPPAHLCGWAGAEPGTAPKGLAAVGMRGVMAAIDAAADLWSDFRAIVPIQAKRELRSRERQKIWEYAKRINEGKPFETLKQLDGDCVAAGARHGIIYRHGWEIAGNKEEEKFRYPFTPFHYGTSRVDVGGGRLGRDAGSLGSWMAQALLRYGVLFDDDAGVPGYSKAVSEAWGYQGPPKKFYAVAKDNLLESAAPVTTAEQIREALISDEPVAVTIASMAGWAMQPVEYKGYHVFKSEGSFAHQTVFLDWMDDPFPAAYRLNSWGPAAHGRPLNGEPPGGAWWRAEDLQRELRRGQCEAYVLRLFRGDKAGPNHGLI